MPGVSRSGATISMGLFLGYDREAATRYAFLLAIPAVVGAGVYKLKDIPGGENDYGTMPTIVGTLVSFAVGLAVIHWLLRYVSTQVVHAVRGVPDRPRRPGARARGRRRDRRRHDRRLI